MKKALILCLLFLAQYTFGQVTNVKAGLWSDLSVWSNGMLPTDTTAIILNFDITIDINATCASLTLNGHNVTVNIGTNFSVVGNNPTDADGNIYDTVMIGSQVWMKENLRTTHYADGSSMAPANPIYLPTYGTYCYYENDTSNLRIFGMLYDWYAVSSPSHICPNGWHVASVAEWNTLINYLGGASVAGSAMKQAGTTYWSSPNVASNSSGFSALPGGASIGGSSYGEYNWMGQSTYFWTVDSVIDYPEPYSYYVELDSWTGSSSTGTEPTYWSMYCRCVKDN